MKHKIRINVKIVLFALAAILITAAIFAARNKSAVKNAETTEDMAEYLASFGWEVGLPPTSEKDVIIPAKFSEVYEQYNSLQKKQGFDLLRYRGDAVKSYTFEVLNFPHASGSKVFANILVCDGYVIGGDLSSYAMDGFMLGLDGKTSVYE